MVDRQGDNRAGWEFPMERPGMTFETHPFRISLPTLVESIGTDGRHLGCIRPFPGFLNSSSHGLPDLAVDDPDDLELETGGTHPHWIHPLSGSITSFGRPRFFSYQKSDGGQVAGLATLATQILRMYCQFPWPLNSTARAEDYADYRQYSLHGDGETEVGYEWVAANGSATANTYYLRDSLNSTKALDPAIVFGSTEEPQTLWFDGSPLTLAADVTALNDGEWGVASTTIATEEGTDFQTIYIKKQDGSDWNPDDYTHSLALNRWHWNEQNGSNVYYLSQSFNPNSAWGGTDWDGATGASARVFAKKPKSIRCGAAILSYVACSSDAEAEAIGANKWTWHRREADQSTSHPNNYTIYIHLSGDVDPNSLDLGDLTVQPYEGSCLLLSYTDSSAGTTGLRILEFFNQSYEFSYPTMSNFDVASLGTQLYFVSDAVPDVTLPESYGIDVGQGWWASYADRLATMPLNRAYYDLGTHRYMGKLPIGVLIAAVNETQTAQQSHGYPLSSSYVWSTGSTADGSLGDWPDGHYSVGFQPIDYGRGRRGYFRFYTQGLYIASNQVTTVRLGRQPGDQYGLSHMGASTPHHWFIPQHGHLGVASCWGIDTISTNSDGDFAGRLYMSAAIEEAGVPSNYKATNVAGPMGLVNGLAFLDEGETTINTSSDHYLSQISLASLEPYDPYLDEYGAAPRLRLLEPYAGLLVGVGRDTTPPELSEVIGSEVTRTGEFLCWSSLLSSEPENFPLANAFMSDDPGERIQSLIPCGDYLYVNGTSSIYQMARSGSDLAINRVQTKMGGVSATAATGVGNTFFVVTASGVKAIDPNRNVQTIHQFDRLIQDADKWGNKLAHVHMAYDATAGCLILLNTSTHECAFLWENTGAMTLLYDCPWSYLVDGKTSSTSARAYFIMDDGRVHCIDSARSNYYKGSMCGHRRIGEMPNHVADSGCHLDMLVSKGTFHEGQVGFEVYFHDGANEGLHSTISDYESEHVVYIDTLYGYGEAPAEGDHFSVAPVFTRVVCPPLSGQGGYVDPYVARVTAATTCAMSNIRTPSEATGEDEAGFFQRVYLGIKDSETDKTRVGVKTSVKPESLYVKAATRGTQLYPFVECCSGDFDFQMFSVLVHGMIQSNEAVSRQAVVTD